MLRALILMTSLGVKSYTLWSKELSSKTRLAVILVIKKLMKMRSCCERSNSTKLKQSPMQRSQ
jgi:hypothetical protein